MTFSLKKGKEKRKEKSEKQELSQTLPSRLSQNVSLPHLAAKESLTVASTVEKGKGEGDW